MWKFSSFLFLSMIVSCTPANPIQLSDAPDSGSEGIEFPDASEPDADNRPTADSTPMDEGVEDAGVDGATDGGQSDMALCADADCSDETVQSDDEMDTSVRRACVHNVDCSSAGEICSSTGQCTQTSSPNLDCGDVTCSERYDCVSCARVASENEDCVEPLECSDEAVVCQGVTGAECQSQCQCEGTLICDLETQKCAECLPISDQCDDLSECNDEGLCAPFYTFPSDTQDVIRRLLVERLVDASKDLTGTRPIGLMTLSLTPPITQDEDELTELKPEILLGDGVDRCSLITEIIDSDPTIDDDQKRRIEGVFGCTIDGSQTSRFLWTLPLLITNDESELACLVYRPRMVAVDNTTCVRWRLWLGPCQSVWRAQIPEGVCTLATSDDMP
ncbi:MAG: hypothetical protein VX589_20165 [Myxococcota bacterium]|nr:hypothetical protein [Myxococcota bacterium]